MKACSYQVGRARARRKTLEPLQSRFGRFDDFFKKPHIESPDKVTIDATSPFRSGPDSGKQAKRLSAPLPASKIMDNKKVKREQKRASSGYQLSFGQPSSSLIEITPTKATTESGDQSSPFEVSPSFDSSTRNVSNQSKARNAVVSLLETFDSQLAPPVKRNESVVIKTVPSS